MITPERQAAYELAVQRDKAFNEAYQRQCQAASLRIQAENDNSLVGKAVVGFKMAWALASILKNGKSN